MPSNKEIALSFLKTITARKVKEAYELYIAQDFCHHNAYYPSDRASLEQGMQEAHTKFPNMTLTVHHTFEEDDMVAIHSEVHMTPGDSGIAVVHLFKIEEGKIIEMWDVGQQIPENLVNDKGLF